MTTRSTVGKDVNTLRVQLLDSLSTNSGLTRAVSITLSAEMTRFIMQSGSVSAPHAKTRPTVCPPSGAGIVKGKRWWIS